MPSLRGENGIALPVTIFVITVLTITLAAAFARVDADRAVAVGSGDVVSAATVAQSGLQAYFGTTNTRPPDGDSVRFYPPTVSGGYADVVAHVVKKPLDPLAPWIYVVRSTGYVIVPELGATHQAVRTMAQFAQWQTGLIRQFAAFTAANALDDRDPNAITIDGNDLCGDSAAAWSVRTRSSSDMNQGTYLPSAAIESDDDDWVADTAGVAWNLIVNGAFVPDYSSLVTGETLYKSHVIQGNATLNNAWGTGLLAVTGDLTTTGVLAKWEGIVLVGGEIFFNADSTVFLGMVISGLDADSSVGGSAPNARIGLEPVYIRYDSCRVGQTIAGWTGFAPVRNAWVDTWPSY